MLGPSDRPLRGYRATHFYRAAAPKIKKALALWAFGSVARSVQTGAEARISSMPMIHTAPIS
jgi:hypothetical protein